MGKLIFKRIRRWFWIKNYKTFCSYLPDYQISRDCCIGFDYDYDSKYGYDSIYIKLHDRDNEPNVVSIPIDILENNDQFWLEEIIFQLKRSIIQEYFTELIEPVINILEGELRKQKIKSLWKD